MSGSAQTKLSSVRRPSLISPLGVEMICEIRGVDQVTAILQRNIQPRDRHFGKDKDTGHFVGIACVFRAPAG